MRRLGIETKATIERNAIIFLGIYFSILGFKKLKYYKEY